MSALRELQSALTYDIIQKFIDDPQRLMLGIVRPIRARAQMSV